MMLVAIMSTIMCVIIFNTPPYFLALDASVARLFILAKIDC